jgi:hypothetical protein
MANARIRDDVSSFRRSHNVDQSEGTMFDSVAVAQVPPYIRFGHSGLPVEISKLIRCLRFTNQFSSNFGQQFSSWANFATP